MEMQLKDGVVLYVVLLVILVVAAILIFNYRNPTQEQRDANMNRLYVGIGVGILVLTGGFLLYNGGLNVNDYVNGTAKEGEYGWGKSGKSQEYGFRDAFREWREGKKVQSQARKEAKKAGLSGDEVSAAVRDAKMDYRQMKKAGQDAKLKARQEYRASNPSPSLRASSEPM